MRELADYIKGMLAADQPQSFARGACMFIIYFLVVGFCYVWSKTTVLPDVPPGWVALITLLYGSSKAGDVITTIKGVANVASVDMEQPPTAN